MNDIIKHNTGSEDFKHVLIGRIKTIFPIEVFEELPQCGGLYMPKYDMYVIFGSKSDTIAAAIVPPDSVIINIENDDIFTVAGRIYATIRRIDNMRTRAACHMLTLPREVILQIILFARRCGSIDLRTLRSLLVVSKAITDVVRLYRNEIAKHYSTITNSDGNEYHWFCGMFHRGDDLPAIIHGSGSLEWYRYGKLHRNNDLPARVIVYDYDLCDCSWYQNDKIHRDNDKPAIISGIVTEDALVQYGGQYDAEHPPTFAEDYFDEVDMKWYQRGKLHRGNDLPAVVEGEGAQMWYQRGKLHRARDRPAIVYDDGEQEWWIQGKRVVHD